MHPDTRSGGPQIIACKHCRGPLITTVNGKQKLRVKSRVLAFEDGVAQMVCPYCGKDTPITEIRLVLGQNP